MFPINNVIKELHIFSNQTLVLAAVWIITQVYAPSSRGQTLISQYANTKMAYMEHNDMIETILIEISSSPNTRILLEADKTYDDNNKGLFDIYRYLNNEEYFYHLNGNKDKAIWFIDSLESFQHLIDDLLNERNNYYRNGFFCIIYTGREADRLKIIRIMFRRLFRIYVINVNVLMTVGKSVYVYTYFPFSRTKCHNVEPDFYGLFGPITNYNYSRRKFFPKKMLNMWRCKVKVTTWTLLPFIKIDYNRTTGELISLEGIEGRLLVLLAERMNFSIQIVEEPNRRAGNGTSPGAIKMLRDGLTNITVMCLMYDKARQQVAQPAYTYLQVPMNLAIPLGEMMTSFERLIRPFKYIIWSCLSSSVLLGVLIIFLLKSFYNRKVQEFVFGHGNRTPFTNLLNVFYGGPISGHLPRRNFARYLLALFILYTSVMRNAYIAQLFLILQDSRARSELDTVNETLKQNFTFYAYGIAVPILRGASSNHINIRLLDNDQNSVPSLFKILGKDENAKIAITLLGHIIRAYNQDPENVKHPVNIMPEPILNAPLTFYMRKHSYLAFEINELLLNIMSAGLIGKFEQLSLTERAYMSKETERMDSFPLYLLIGLFSVHFVLLMLSTLVFLLEMWSKHSPLTRKVIDFFNA